MRRRKTRPTMKLRRLLVSALLLLPLCAFADTVDLGAHGTLTIAPPKGWKLTSASKDTGVDLTIVPSNGANAQLLFSVVYVPAGATAAKADVDEKVKAEAEQFVPVSVEKKVTLRKYSLSGDAYGAYCVFTDASLVGQPPQKDNFKVITVGVIWFNDSVGVAVSQVCDDEHGPEFAEMLAATNSASLAAK